MLLFLPHLPTISRPQLRVRAPVVKVRNLECAVQDSKTLQKHTQTIINQRKLRDISSHPIAHQPSVINGRCIPPNYRFLMRPSVTGIGHSVRQFRSEQHPTTHEYPTKTVPSHPNSPWQGLPVTPRLCPLLARFCWPHPHSSTLTALAYASAPPGRHTRTSTSPPSYQSPTRPRLTSSTCSDTTSRSR